MTQLLLVMALGVMLVRMDRPIIMTMNMGGIERVRERMKPDGA